MKGSRRLLWKNEFVIIVNLRGINEFVTFSEVKWNIVIKHPNLHQKLTSSPQ